MILFPASPAEGVVIGVASHCGTQSIGRSAAFMVIAYHSPHSAQVIGQFVVASLNSISVYPEKQNLPCQAFQCRLICSG